jgi:hypothetical protein
LENDNRRGNNRWEGPGERLAEEKMEELHRNPVFHSELKELNQVRKAQCWDSIGTINGLVSLKMTHIQIGVAWLHLCV